MTWLDKPTFPRLGRSTLNELQQNQDEKASLVCVRVQSPSGLALVPCAFEYDRRKWPITMLNHTEKHPWYRKVIVFFFFFFGTLRSYVVRSLLVRSLLRSLLRSPGGAAVVLLRSTARRRCYSQLPSRCQDPSGTYLLCFVCFARAA